MKFVSNPTKEAGFEARCINFNYYNYYDNLSLLYYTDRIVLLMTSPLQVDGRFLAPQSVLWSTFSCSWLQSRALTAVEGERVAEAHYGEHQCVSEHPTILWHIQTRHHL